MNSIRLLIVDDHEIVREGLRLLLSEESDMQVIGEASDGAQAVNLARALTPDVILMDLVMPGTSGIEATQRLRGITPASRVLVLTTFADDARVHDAIQAGAIGYLLKDVKKAELVKAIRDAAQGKPALHVEAQRVLMRQASSPSEQFPHNALTARELDVLRLIARGQSNKEIAASLHLTEGTVKVYVSTVLEKLGVADRTQAALYAVKHNLTNE